MRDRVVRRIAAMVLLACASVAGSGQAAKLVQTDRSILSRAAPLYPERARLMGIEGVVIVLVHVLPSGSVASAKATSPRTLLTYEAERCALRWRFAPATETTETVVQVNFELLH